jgi:hypothetical protein
MNLPLCRSWARAVALTNRCSSSGGQDCSRRASRQLCDVPPDRQGSADKRKRGIRSLGQPACRCGRRGNLRRRADLARGVDQSNDRPRLSRRVVEKDRGLMSYARSSQGFMSSGRPGDNSSRDAALGRSARRADCGERSPSVLSTQPFHFIERRRPLRHGPERTRVETMSDCCAPNENKRNGRYDLVVVGDGSAGFSAAITAAKQGAQVALVGHGTIGSTCVNIGCVPSKALIRATEASGANPLVVRMLAVVACGAIAGLGGAVLSLQQVGTFTDGMTSGRGYLALAALIVRAMDEMGSRRSLPSVWRC